MIMNNHSQIISQILHIFNAAIKVKFAIAICVEIILSVLLRQLVIVLHMKGTVS